MALLGAYLAYVLSNGLTQLLIRRKWRRLSPLSWEGSFGKGKDCKANAVIKMDAWLCSVSAGRDKKGAQESFKHPHSSWKINQHSLGCKVADECSG